MAATPSPGRTALSFGRDRDGVIYVPANLPKEPVPLVLLLHGAGGSSQGIGNRLGNTADSLGFVLLIPDSRGPTWDAIRGAYGPDIAFIDSALKVVFARVSIDPARVIVSGFSDGASYALGLGRINGDLFSKIVAFSPGFIPDGGAPSGKPDVYITHGDNDQILPYEVTSQRIIPAMKKAGYAVTLKQFSGGHTVPPDLAVEALRWAVTKRAAK